MTKTAKFWLKLKNNVASKAYWFGGWAYALGGDANDLDMLSDGFTEVSAPDWLNVPIDSDDAGGSGSNRTGGYDGVFKINTPVMLHEWDSVKHNFNVQSTSTDPATSTTFSTQDAVYIGAVDAQYARGDDGKIYLDIYQHNTAESDVGLSEAATLRHPVGGANTVVIELI